MVRDSYKLKLINPSGSLKRKEIVIIRKRRRIRFLGGGGGNFFVESRE